MAREVISRRTPVLKPLLEQPLQLELRWNTITGLPSRIILFFFDLYYQLCQMIIIRLFKPTPPKTDRQPSEKPFGRIAVIGAGLTGVSSAAHCIAHNFEVVLYDKNKSVGGIWSHVNSTSGLQINSLIYRFHPGVFWREGFPHRDEIVGEITRIWREYKLESRTKFNTEVVKVERVDGTGPRRKSSDIDQDAEQATRSKWLIHVAGQEEPDGPFDAVIATIGTCGDPMRIGFDGTEDFENAGGRVVHSSELDQLSKNDDVPGEDTEHGSKEAEVSSINSREGPAPDDDNDAISITEARQPVAGISYADKAKSGTSLDLGSSEENEEGSQEDGHEPLDVKGKTIAIIGSGASGIEAAEWAVQKGAGKVYILARADKWIIPRNVVFDTMLSMQPFGREMPLSFIPENMIRSLHYRNLAGAVAPKGKPGLFESTPVVNDDILDHIRSGLVRYIRCDTECFTEKGVLIKRHEDDKEQEIRADVAILATGFKRPSLDFLPKDLFPSGYERPNLYLQTFATEDWSVLLTNAAYTSALGTVGHFHIGIYTRILLTFLLDKSARPIPEDMKLWVDVLRFLKRGARGGALGFFTYMELTIWFLTFHLFRPDRLRWMFFIMQGWGVTYQDENKLKVE